jgi:hypothetical protein
MLRDSFRTFRIRASNDAATAARLAVAIAAALLASSIAAPAQQFSAELVRRDADGQVSKGRLMVAGDKVRIETPELPTGFFIVRGDTRAAYFVRPARHEFMDARQSSLLTEILAPVDPDTPCRRWQAMAEISGSAEAGAPWRCERLGKETRDGRDTIRYAMTSPLNRRYAGWIDPRLGFPVRLEADDGSSTELADIREAPQPDSAFEIPTGFRKFDPLQLIERIKQSDVWVEPVK